MSNTTTASGPDLTAGVPLDDIPDGSMIGGHVGEESVLLARVNGALHALGAKCTHYGGPLTDGLIVGDTVRCPLHHARFCLRTGQASGAPALDPVSCWRVDVHDGLARVREREESAVPARMPAESVSSVVIVGGGAAGEAAAETLRREGYDGPVTIVSDDTAPPCDRPNLSKDYLAGSAQPEWIPLRDATFYREQDITLRLDTPVASIDPARAEVLLTDGSALGYGALLLATGAEPVRLNIEGADLPHVFYLRTLADCDALITAVEAGARRAVVVGAGFIGLEVAASLRERDIEVHLVAPEACPLERIMGRQLGEYIQQLHEAGGVRFHLGQSVEAFDTQHVRLGSGEQLAADLIIAGIGVRPRVALAEAAGLDVDNGIVVDELLRTSAPNVHAAGDVACWPDAITGQRIRVEHWVVAQRQGQAAARNILGAARPYREAPFFWSQHYGSAIRYVGHARQWDRIDINGDTESGLVARFVDGDRVTAVATVNADVTSLECEAAMEAGTKSN